MESQFGDYFIKKKENIYNSLISCRFNLCEMIGLFIFSVICHYLN